jgi:NAD(P)H-flavin reductase
VSSASPRERSFGRLVCRRDVGGLVLHDLTPPEGGASSYVEPGQYVSVGPSGNSTYFVLAGEPGASTWEVLVRAGGDVADALLALAVGAEVELSSALGHGFPLAEAEGRMLFVLATGSGVAAVRPVLHARIRAGLAASTEVFLGVRSQAEVPLKGELQARRGEGVRVTVCFSREAVAGAPSGYVQDALHGRVTELGERAKRAMIFAAGTSAMIRGARETARVLGLDETDVRTNY